MVKVSIVIVSYNTATDLLNCLSSISQINQRNFKLSIVVVDNHSFDGSVSAVKEKFPEVHLVENTDNLGYSGGNNLGIIYSLQQGADYILILNPDITVDKSIIEELLSVASKKLQIGVVSPKIYFAPGAEYHKKRYEKSDQGKVIWWAGGRLDWDNIMTIHRGVDQVDNDNFNRAEKTETVVGTAMFIKKEVFKRIGLFDEKYFLYFEESDFCQRAVKAGFELWYAPMAIAWHQNATATGIGSTLQDYYTTRNRLLFGFRYAPLRSKLALARQMLSFLILGRPWVKKGTWDFLLGRFGPGSYRIQTSV